MTSIDDTRRPRADVEDPLGKLVELFDYAPVAYFVLDQNGAIQEVNVKGASLLRVEKPDLLGLPMSEFVVPDDIDAFRSHISSAFRTRDSVKVDIRLRRQCGTVFSARMESLANRPAEDRSSHVRLVVTDITAEKKAEESVRQYREKLEGMVKERTAAVLKSERRLSQAVHLAGLGLWVWDVATDRCIFCSETHARLHGLSVEEYIARSAAIDEEFSTVHPDDRVRVKRKFKELRQGVGFEFEYRLLTPSGKVRYVRESGMPVFDDDGNMVQEFGSIQDITRQKQTE